MEIFQQNIWISIVCPFMIWVRCYGMVRSVISEQDVQVPDTLGP